jgi:hypothetical protein
MDLRKMRPFSLALPPRWFLEFANAGANQLWPFDGNTSGANKSGSEQYLELCKKVLEELPLADQAGAKGTADKLNAEIAPSSRLPAIVWRRLSLSVVDTLVVPVFLRTVQRLGTLDRNVPGRDQLLLFGSAGLNGLMSLGRTEDGIERSNGAHSIEMICRLIGESCGRPFSVAVLNNLPLRDVLKIAALAMCADGCRQVFYAFRPGGFDCTTDRNEKAISELLSKQQFSMALFNLRLASLCLDHADSELVEVSVNEEKRRALYRKLEDSLGEGFAETMTFMLSVLLPGKPDDGWSERWDAMDTFRRKQRFLLWRDYAVILIELQRLLSLVESPLKKRNKMAILALPKLKTHLLQRIAQRNAGQQILTAMYPSALL